MQIRKCTISIADSVWIPAAISLFFISFRWISAAILAAAVHELGHILAILVCKGEIKRIRIGLFGAKITSAPLDPWEAVICTAAGPAASFLLMLLYHALPRIAFCGVAQAIFNLLPIPGMDGFHLFQETKNMFRKIPCKETEERVQ